MRHAPSHRIFRTAMRIPSQGYTSVESRDQASGDVRFRVERSEATVGSEYGILYRNSVPLTSEEIHLC